MLFHDTVYDVRNAHTAATIMLHVNFQITGGCVFFMLKQYRPYSNRVNFRLCWRLIFSEQGC